MNGTEKLRYGNAKKDQTPPTYWLSTTMVQEYLQQRINMLVAALRKSDEKYENLEDVKIQVVGSQASPEFIPLCVVLPPDVLEKEFIRQSEDIPSFFLNSDEDDELTMIPAIQQLFKIYAYSKEDIKLFKNPSWIRKMNITRKVATYLETYSTPRYWVNYGENKDETPNMVMMFIDPMRIFHDMLVDENNRRAEFKIEVDKIKKIRNGQYEYHVRRIFERNKKRNNDAQFFKEIDGLLRR